MSAEGGGEIKTICDVTSQLCRNVRHTATNLSYSTVSYEGCPESIQPFWISREQVAWQWGNLTAGRRRPYCPSVNSHSPMGLVSRQWDAVDCACVLCDRRIHTDRASRSASSRQCAYPFYSSRAGFCWQSITSPSSVSAVQPKFGSLRLLSFPKAKIAVEREEICGCDGHTVHKLSQRCLTAECLDKRESDSSRMHSKVSSDWLPRYSKAHATGSRDIKKGWIRSGQPSCISFNDTMWWLRLHSCSASDKTNK